MLWRKVIVSLEQSFCKRTLKLKMVVKACPKQPLCIFYKQNFYMKGQILKACPSICFG